MNVRHRHALQTTAVAMLALLYGTQTLAANFDLPASLTGTITHAFDPNAFDPIRPRVVDRLGVTDTSFTTDLGLWSSMSMTLSAGAGNVVAVNLPSGKTGVLEVYVNYLGGGSAGISDVWPSAAQFVGLTGAAPTLITLETDGRVQGNQVSIFAGYTFTEPFSFQAWQLGITGPFISGGSKTFTPNPASLSVSYEDTADGGQFVTFQPVPEPSLSSLGSCGIGLLLSIAAGSGRRGQRKRWPND